MPRAAHDGRIERTQVQPMPFREALTAQHRACDAHVVKIEQAVQRDDWEAAAVAAREFIDASEAHFGYEEQTLFPALEASAPMAVGPTAVMRREHAQMRELFAELLDAVARRRSAALADAVETLLLVMQQHNAKEENILYPMADRTLSGDLLAMPRGPREAG